MRLANLQHVYENPAALREAHDTAFVDICVHYECFVIEKYFYFLLVLNSIQFLTGWGTLGKLREA